MSVTSKTVGQMVREFHEKFGQPRPPRPTVLSGEMLHFRLRFLEEEQEEADFAFRDADLPNLFDALIDQSYVWLGTLDLAGINHDELGPISPNNMLAAMQENNLHRVARLFSVDMPPPALPVSHDQVMMTRAAMHQQKELLAAYYHQAITGNILGTAVVAATALIGLETIAHSLKLPFMDGFVEVHNSNMRKRRATRPDESKRGTAFDVIKPEGWRPPNLIDILYHYGWVGQGVLNLMESSAGVQINASTVKSSV